MQRTFSATDFSAQHARIINRSFTLFTFTYFYTYSYFYIYICFCVSFWQKSYTCTFVPCIILAETTWIRMCFAPLCQKPPTLSHCFLHHSDINHMNLDWFESFRQTSYEFTLCFASFWQKSSDCCLYHSNGNHMNLHSFFT